MDSAEFVLQGLGSKALHAGQHPDPTTGSRAMPIHQTTSYCFRDTQHAADLFALKEMGWIYTRLMNPTTDVFEQRMAALEGGIGALGVSSGQQAITVSLLNLAHSGQHLVSAKALYGGTITLLGQTFKRLGIDVTFVDATKLDEIERAIRPETRAVYIESLANPKNDVLDYEAIASTGAQARSAGGLRQHRVDADRVPAVRVRDRHLRLQHHEVHRRARDQHRRLHRRQRQLRLDQGSEPLAAVHQAGRVVPRRRVPRGGRPVVLHHHLPHPLAARSWGGDEPVQRVSVPARFGDAPSADAAALPERSGRGRVPRSPSAGHLGQLSGPASHPHYELARRYMPMGPGAILGFGIQGGREAGRKFIESVKMCSHLANIGDAKTLVIHPATTTHSQQTVEELKRPASPTTTSA
jgi:O-acetylhomoserine (thiol)-lyase